MIINRKRLQKFEKELAKKSHPDYFKQLAIFEALFEEAKSMGIFPLKNKLEGIETDIRLAKALHVQKTS